MIYAYFCKDCSLEFDVVKSVSEIERIENCNFCGKSAQRTIKPAMLMGISEWKQEFNPAFGCVVKSKKHQNEILAKFKDNGKEMIEIGSEPLENIHKKFDSEREQKRKDRWNEPTEKIVQEVLG